MLDDRAAGSRPRPHPRTQGGAGGDLHHRPRPAPAGPAPCYGVIVSGSVPYVRRQSGLLAENVVGSMTP